MSTMENLDNVLAQLSSKKIQIRKPTPEQLAEGHKRFIRWQIENPNNFSYWSDKIAPHLIAKGIRYPRTMVVSVPENVMEACFLEKEDDYETVRKWVHMQIMPDLFGVEFPIFMKNGCFSNKFNFKRSCLLAEYDEQHITDHFITLQNMSLSCETGGNMEIVFREFIQPKEGTPTIYEGMPLRPEMRIFYDFDKHSFCYAVNYWDWDYCHDSICQASAEDAKVYESYYPTLKERYECRMRYFTPRILSALRRVDKMEGIWSLDFILDEHEAWFIDAAIAWQSAYWDEDWEAKGLQGL